VKGRWLVAAFGLLVSAEICVMGCFDQGSWVLALIAAGYGATLLALYFRRGETTDIAKTHLGAILGAPSAAMFALGLILYFRLHEGSAIKLAAWGVVAEGSAAWIIMWCVVFTVIGLVLRALW
jgi:hypothetical protein